MNESKVESIRQMLKRKFDLKSEVCGQYINIREFDGMINADTYEIFQELAVSIVDSIRDKYDVDCGYELIGMNGECDLIFEIIE